MRPEQRPLDELIRERVQTELGGPISPGLSEASGDAHLK